ncbi:MAG: hypothetical protein PUE15_10825 [Prevotella sp.]|nr:hypothetical protein [Prevotella sp.]
MKSNLMMMAAIAAAGMTIVSCSSDNGNMAEGVQPGKAHVRLVCGMGVSVSPISRAALSANGKALTDLYILDYDKATGKLLQVLHQTSTAADFAEPDLTLDYGEHVLKVVATRSQEPTLWDEQKTTWQVEPNILTPVTATQPVMLTSTKTSDTFGAEKEVSVGIGMATTVSITLDRLVAKLVVSSTDVFPDDCTTITLDFQEYRTLSWTTMDVIEAVNNQRVADVTSLRGTAGTVLSYFVLAPKDGYQTDITLTTNRTEGSPYSTITVPDVTLERNKVTTISGPIYGHGQGLQVTVNDAWDSEGHDINI